MRCGACAARITQALQELEGVYAATVDLGKNRARMRYAPKKIDVARIIAAIKKLGYKAKLAGGARRSPAAQNARLGLACGSFHALVGSTAPLAFSYAACVPTPRIALQVLSQQRQRRCAVSPIGA